MTDEIQELRAALRDAPPIVPGKGAKRIAMERAMEAFDEKIAPAAQGNRITDRLTGTARAVLETLIGRRSMRHSAALAGGVSLAVLTLAVLSTAYVQTELRNTGPVAGKPATPQSTTPPKTAAPPAVTLPPQIAVSPPAATESRDMARPPAAKTETTKLAAVPRQKPAAQPQRRVVPRLHSPDAGGRVAVQPRARAHTRQLLDRLATADPRVSGARPRDQRQGYYEERGRDRFETVTPNPVKIASEDPVSTFSIDVDTASYSFVRASLTGNTLPQKDAVRVEELINYFPYDYARPADKATPFTAHVSVFPAPWAADKKLLHIGIAGYDLKREEKPRSNLVFLLDTSGSMNAPNKLPLMVNSMKLLLESLEPEDTVAIVTYAGSAGTVLEPTAVKDKTKIMQALNTLRPHGSTAGAEGIRQAYELARQSYGKDSVNRVILATDGDFNIGITNQDELKSYIERQRKSGITLSVLGFGRGNYNDALMQTLAQNGNGNAAYIDTLNEARKVLVEEAGSTLFTIAKDVKLQLEFNPKTVAEYRLIGYETRLLKREDFNNDKIDAGDIGAGHTVTAIYEITPSGSPARLVDDLRYQQARPRPATTAKDGEYAFLKIRYKLPDAETSTLVTTPVDRASERGSVADAATDVRFATAVAAFGQILRGGRYTGAYGYDDVIRLAQSAKGADEFGYRAEFINLVRLAKSAPALEAQPPR